MRNKKLCTAVCLSTLASIFAGQAYAETWIPNGNGNMDSVGLLTVNKGFPVSLGCRLSADLNINVSDATVSNILVYGGIFGICNGRVTFLNGPYNMEGLVDDIVTIEGVYATAQIGGDCAGDLIGTFNQSTGVITFDQATLPGLNDTSACVFSGQIATTPQLSYTIP